MKKKGVIKVDKSGSGSSSRTSSRTVVGGKIGSVVASIVGTSGSGSLSDEVSAIPGCPIVGGTTGSVAANTVVVSGTKSLEISHQRLEIAVGGDIINTVVDGRADVIARIKANSDSELELANKTLVN